MSRDKRLTEAYEHARVEQIDDTSRYVFIGDCHRGDGSLSDEFTRNENAYLHALEQYFREGYTYVEVGDGDELWEFSSYRAIKRAHAEAFAAIKRFFDAGRFVLLWGNHNNELRRRSYTQEHLYTLTDRQTGEVQEFLPGIEPCEALRLVHAQTGQEFLALHGHQGDFGNDGGWVFSMLALRYFWRYLHAVGAKNPVSPAVNRRKREHIERDYHAWVGAHRVSLICGHTHLYSYPVRGELPYFNAGACVYPSYLTALELADGQITLVKWHVAADESGVLRVRRQEMRGPAPIAGFDIR